MSKKIKIITYFKDGTVVIDNCDLVDISILSPLHLQQMIMWGNFNRAVIP
jgi:hypothetical protein